MNTLTLTQKKKPDLYLEMDSIIPDVVTRSQR
jgi:hypothetical protein